MPTRVMCQRCESTFIFDNPRQSHFVNGICCHCQHEEEFGSSVLTIKLLDGRTGLTKDIQEKMIHHSHDPAAEIETAKYLWLEGNWACDCNRSAFMYPDDESQHINECKGDNLILVLAMSMNGRPIFDAADSDICTGAGRFKD